MSHLEPRKSLPPSDAESTFDASFASVSSGYYAESDESNITLSRIWETESPESTFVISSNGAPGSESPPNQSSNAGGTGDNSFRSSEYRTANCTLDDTLKLEEAEVPSIPDSPVLLGASSSIVVVSLESPPVSAVKDKMLSKTSIPKKQVEAEASSSGAFVPAEVSRKRRPYSCPNTNM